jgi:phosphoribosylanthranilate isomerase
MAMKQPAIAQIKFCGLMRPEDIDACLTLGVEAIGFVFYPPSARALSIEQAKRLRAQVGSRSQVVGLFVNAEPQSIAYCATEVGLDVIQVHGDESALQCEAIGRATGLPWWRAVRMQGPEDVANAAQNYPQASALLLDSHVQGYGGAGKVFDWRWVPMVREERWPPLVLSGGLTPETVGRAITMTQPWMVDVSSGIQGDSAASKDFAKMQRFVAAVRQERVSP